MAKPGDPRGTRRYRTLRQAAAHRWAKDQAPCWLCAGLLGPIDYQARAGTWNALDIDHSEPVSSGAPALDITTWRSSHARCNRQRGNKTPDEYRQWLLAQQSGKTTPRPSNTTNAISRAMRAAQRPAPGAGRPIPRSDESAGIEKPVTTREWYKRPAS